MRVSGFILFYLSVKRIGAVCKNCDEPINFIDRVISRSVKKLKIRAENDLEISYLNLINIKTGLSVSLRFSARLSSSFLFLGYFGL
jgi:hypothetical protein